MSNFKHTLIIKGEEKAIRALVPGLLALGYVWGRGYALNRGRNTVEGDDFPELSTRYDSKDQLGWVFWGDGPSNDRGIVVQADQPELVMALAAQKEGHEIHPGEWVKVNKTTQSSRYTNGKLYKASKVTPDWLFTEKDNSGSENAIDPKFFTKATAEEIIAHFQSTNNMDTVIAHKNPFDIFKDTIPVPAGTAWLPVAGNSSFYAPQTGKEQHSNHYWLPSEVVEAWPKSAYTPKSNNVTLTIGSANDIVTIYKTGKITTETTGIETTVGRIKQILSALNETPVGGRISGYAVTLRDDVQCIRIGCADENHCFSIAQFKQIVAAYDSLQ